jgi:hypothetical protein
MLLSPAEIDQWPRQETHLDPAHEPTIVPRSVKFEWCEKRTNVGLMRKALRQTKIGQARQVRRAYTHNSTAGGNCGWMVNCRCWAGDHT